MKRNLICVMLAVMLLCAVSVCGFAEAGAIAITGERVEIGSLALLPDGGAAVIYENEGLRLFVPVEYDGLLVTEVPEKDPDGILFEVAEKASVEAAGGREGAGSLFAIARVDREKMQQMRCNDMSGAEIFAKDADDRYYVYLHPTDVRFERESYENAEEDMKQWTELNEWAWNSVRDSFVAENEGLTAESYGNTELDILLARICYADDVSYSISTTEFGPKEAEGVDPLPFAEKLMNAVVYERLDDMEAPDGEYVVLNFPEEGFRFDFFRMLGEENVIRQVWGENHEELYRAVFADETLKASDIMQDWYDSLVADEEMRALGFQPDDLLGTWTEKAAGRGEIRVSKSEDPDEPETYHVEITWAGSANESCFWEMTARAAGCNTLRYENGSMQTIVIDEAGKDTETVNYTDGRGSFTLLSTNELTWQDETGHAGDDCLFVSAG